MALIAFDSVFYLDFQVKKFLLGSQIRSLLKQIDLISMNAGSKVIYSGNQTDNQVSLNSNWSLSHNRSILAPIFPSPWLLEANVRTRLLFSLAAVIAGFTCREKEREKQQQRKVAKQTQKEMKLKLNNNKSFFFLRWEQNRLHSWLQSDIVR